MDDLYENLDNYNEETTIAELQTENKELKLKLEEYASTLEKLQKDLDNLSSEYKKLELNYSSLLKTAKAEIERKTQIITNLNLEKDKMILKSYHNRNVVPNHRSRSQNFKEGIGAKYDKDKMKETENSRKPSPHLENNSTNPDYPSKDKINTSHTDNMRHKLLNISNSLPKHGDPRIDQINTIKENIMQPKSEIDARARIRNRRKSMPAGSFEMETVSSDADEMTNARVSEELSRVDEDRRHNNQNFSDRPLSRISGASSLEDRNSGYHESLSEAHRSRQSRYDSDRIDRHKVRDKSSHRVRDKSSHRVRDKSSHRYKMISPDRFRTRQTGHYDHPHNRWENDRHRVGETPMFDKYCWTRSRETQMNYDRRYIQDHREPQMNYESYPQEQRRLLRSQDTYPMKHKIQHSYGEKGSKRIKLDTNYRLHEDDQRFQDERDYLDKKYAEEQLESLPFFSCESPDYHYPEVATNQIKEIKLTATTKLDDPRITHKKYIIKNNNGKVALSTAEGRNIDLVPLNRSEWGIDPIKMPDALVRRPSLEPQHTTRKESHMEIETPIADTSSIESGEICVKRFESKNSSKELKNERKKPSKHRKEIRMKISEESNNLDNSLGKRNSYKMPKQKQTVEDKINRTDIKDEAPSVKQVHKCLVKEPSKDKSKKNTGVIKTCMVKLVNGETDESDTCDNIFVTRDNKAPLLGSSDLHDKQKYGKVKANLNKYNSVAPRDNETPLQGSSDLQDKQKYSKDKGDLNKYDSFAPRENEAPPQGSSDIQDKQKYSKVKGDLNKYDSVAPRENEAPLQGSSDIHDRQKYSKVKGDLNKYDSVAPRENEAPLQGSSDIHDKQKYGKVKGDLNKYDSIAPRDNEAPLQGSSDLHDKLKYSNDKGDLNIFDSVVPRDNETPLQGSSDIHDKQTYGKIKGDLNKYDSVAPGDNEAPLQGSSDLHDKLKYSKEKCDLNKFDSVVPRDNEASLQGSSDIHNQKYAEAKEVVIKCNNIVVPKDNEALLQGTSDLQDNKICTKDSIVVPRDDEAPLPGSSNLHDTQGSKSKGVVEGDLELSDDENDRPSNVTKTTVNLTLQNDQKEYLEKLNINKKCEKSENMPDEITLVKVSTDICKDKIADDGKKLRSKKKSKCKEIKDESEIKNSALVSVKTTRRKEKVKGTKTKDIKTKFSELFDDSSSLISPEDLGLAPTTRPLDKGLAYFEDAQDLVDLDVIKTVKDSKFKDSIPAQQTCVEKTEHSMSTIENKTLRDTVVSPKTVNICSDLQSAVNEEVIKNIYINLEPEIEGKENDVVKTVVISSGVQPQVTNTIAQDLPIPTEPVLIKTISQELALKALATSTPNKIWHTSVEAEIQAKETDSSCNSTNNHLANVESAPALSIDSSDNSKLDSQTENMIVPDVRIFVRRRRKVMKK